MDGQASTKITTTITAKELAAKYAAKSELDLLIRTQM
jgi:hypothetical protein